MDKKSAKSKDFILIAKYSDSGKQKSSKRLFSGTDQEARKEAQKWHDAFQGGGYRNIRVEVWGVIATSYQGTIRR